MAANALIMTFESISFLSWGGCHMSRWVQLGDVARRAAGLLRVLKYYSTYVCRICCWYPDRRLWVHKLS
jgi:hypothetical protein